MAHFVQIPLENDRSQFLNLDQVRSIEDHPDEQSVRVDFDAQHRVYLDRERAKALLKAIGRPKE